MLPIERAQFGYSERPKRLLESLPAPRGKMTLEVPKVSLDPATIADMIEAQTDAGLSDVRHKSTEHVFDCERRR